MIIPTHRIRYDPFVGKSLLKVGYEDKQAKESDIKATSDDADDGMCEINELGNEVCADISRFTQYGPINPESVDTEMK